MFFHGQLQKTFSAQRCKTSASRARLLNMRAFHSSRRCYEQYLDANQKTFHDVALNQCASDKVVLVDFYADWCGPCKTISPILKKLAGDSDVKTGSGRALDLVTVDTDKELELAHKYQIRALPTVMAFKDGKPVNQFIGALSEGDIRKFLGQL